MSGRDDDRNPARHMVQHRIHDVLALLVRQHELFGPIGEDADAGRAGIDHKVDAALLPFKIQFTVVVENGGRHGEHAAITSAELSH